MNKKEQIREKLITNGVRNLKEFGYPKVNKENIFTDLVYSQFFKRMLEQSKGNRDDFDVVIDEIISEIKTEDD